MSAHQTRSQRKASKVKHIASQHLKNGGCVCFEGRYYQLATDERYADRQLFGQLVCRTYDVYDAMRAL